MTSTRAGDSRHRPAPPLRGHRVTRRGSGRLRHPPAGPPDLAAIAREAVLDFLHDESPATAEPDAAPADGTAAAEPGPAAGQFTAQAVAVQAAALGVATLDRIESAAARLEADIAAALREQTELQGNAGRAAEKAVLAAQAAWASAGTAEAASSSAKASVRRIGRYMSITIVLVVMQLLIAVLFASSTH